MVYARSVNVSVNQDLAEKIVLLLLAKYARVVAIVTVMANAITVHAFVILDGQAKHVI